MLIGFFCYLMPTSTSFSLILTIAHKIHVIIKRSDKNSDTVYNQPVV